MFPRPTSRPFAHHAECEWQEAGVGFAPAQSDTSLGQITPGQISKSGVVTIWKVGNVLWWREIYVFEIVITALLDTEKSNHNMAQRFLWTSRIFFSNRKKKKKKVFSLFVRVRSIEVRQIGRMWTKTSVHKAALSHLIPTHRSYKGSPVHSVQTLLACLCW